MDLIVRNAAIAGRDGTTVDIGIARGRIVALEAALAAEGQQLPSRAGSRLEAISHQE